MAKRVLRFKPRQCLLCGEYFTRKSSNHTFCELCKRPLILAGKRQYRLANLEKSRLQTKSWREANPERMAEHRKKWEEANPKKVKAARAAYSRANRGIRNAALATYRANKKCATPLWFDKEEVAYIYKLAKERDLEVDHIVPLRSDLVCGLHVQDNMRCIPSGLNQKKGNRYWPDMWQ